MHATVTIAAAMWAGCSGQPEALVSIGDTRFETRTIEVEGSTVAIEDVNGDGQMDIVSAGRRLSVLLGDGDGGLRPGGRAEAGENPADLAFADLDADGAVDIVIANHDVHHVTILFGDGRGGFAPATRSPLAVDVDPHPHAVGAADLDGDGRADLLVDHSPRGAPAPGLRRDAGGVLVRRGLGGGRFESPGEVFESGGAPYRGFAVGDVNGDGKPDVLTPHDREVGVLLNTSEAGRVSFERGAPIRATAPFAVRLGDLNADGWTDLVAAAGQESARVEVFLNDGRGGFGPAGESPMRLARGGKNIELGDFNGDGVTDAAVSAYRSAEVMIVLGGAQSLETARVPAGHAHPWGLAAGDLNGDGADDLVIVGDGEQRGRLCLSVEQ